jgi:hypothetical protein
MIHECMSAELHVLKPSWAHLTDEGNGQTVPLQGCGS